LYSRWILNDYIFLASWWEAFKHATLLRSMLNVAKNANLVAPRVQCTKADIATRKAPSDLKQGASL
jgi:hypothetical protein